MPKFIASDLFIYMFYFLKSYSCVFYIAYFQQVSSYVNLFTMLESGSLLWYLAWGQRIR